jgi:hypothetical protein
MSDEWNPIKNWANQLPNWLEGFKEKAQEIKESLWVKSKSWTFGWLKPEQVPGTIQDQDLSEGKDYVEIYMTSLKIPNQAIMTRRYFGTVHSFTSLPSLSPSAVGGQAAFNVVTTPSLLQNVDSQNLSNVVQADIPLLGPVPYQGGNITVEAGVFSVLAEDLILPFLKVVEDVSKAASISIVSQAIPFIQPIEEAIYHLIGAGSGNKLEIGIKTTLKKSGYLVVVGTSADEKFLSSLRLKADGRLYVNDKEIEYAYMVLAVKSSKNRNLSGIPEVLKAFQELQTGIRGVAQKEAIMSFYNTFTRTTYGCADLLPEDAEIINTQIYKRWVEPALRNIKDSTVTVDTVSETDLESMQAIEEINLLLKDKS